MINVDLDVISVSDHYVCPREFILSYFVRRYLIFSSSCFVLNKFMLVDLMYSPQR